MDHREHAQEQHRDNGGDRGFELAAVIDVAAVQSLMDAFFALTGIGIGIVDRAGEVLVATGWQTICTDFHRAHPETCRHCRESDLELSAGVTPGDFKLYRCKNGMWDIATPIEVDGERLGSVFLGQFLFDDEEPDRQTFRDQARRYGFDEATYLNALDGVPRWSRATVDAAMRFYSRLAELLAGEGLNAIRRHASEDRNRLLLEHAGVGIGHYDLDGTVLMYNRRAREHLGGESWEFEGRHVAEVLGAEWGARIVDRIRTTAAAGRTLEFEDEVELATGRLWFLSSYAPIPDHGGRTTAVQIISHDITGRKQADRALLETRTDLEALVENTDSAIWSIDSELRLVRSNSVFRNLMRASLGTVPAAGETVVPSGLPADLRAKWTELYRRALRGERFRVETTTTLADPQLVLELSFNPIRAPGKSPHGVTIHARDLTERRLAEAEAAATEQRFRETLENARLIAVALDRDGCLTFVNEFTLRLTGWQREEVLGGEWFARFVPQSHVDEVRRLFQTALATGDFPVHYDNPIVTRAGEERLVHWSNTVVRDPAGRIREVVSLGEDWTEVAAAEAALRASEARYRTLFETMRQGVFHQAADGTLLDVNPAALEMFGLTHDELLGRTSHHPEWDVVREDGTPLPAAEHPSMVALRTGRPVRDVVVGVRNARSGARLWLSVNAQPELRPGEDAPFRVAVTLHDLTDRKQAEAQLTEQLAELRRWHAVTLDREERILELKREVNEALALASRPVRYATAADSAGPTDPSSPSGMSEPPAPGAR